MPGCSVSQGSRALQARVGSQLGDDERARRSRLRAHHWNASVTRVPQRLTMTPSARRTIGSEPVCKRVCSPCRAAPHASTVGVMSALPRRSDPPTLPTVTAVPQALEPVTRDPFSEGVAEAVVSSAPVAAHVKPGVDGAMRRSRDDRLCEDRRTHQRRRAR